MTYANIRTRRLPFPVRYLMDLATFRHLCWNLVGSDLRSRFRRSYLGILWAIIQPLAFALVIAAVWGALRGAEDYWTFAAYVFSGMVVWECFANVFIGAQDALPRAQGYLKQTRVPFLIFQIRVPLLGMVLLLFGILGLYGFLTFLQQVPPPGYHLLLIPAFIVAFFLFTVPTAILMSIVGLHFRDVRHASTVLIQGLFFLSPVMLPRESLDVPQLTFLQFANPMIPVLDMFRDPVLYGQYWNETDVVTLAAWIGGLWIVALAVSMKVGRRLVFAL